MGKSVTVLALASILIMGMIGASPMIFADGTGNPPGEPLCELDLKIETDDENPPGSHPDNAVLTTDLTDIITEICIKAGPTHDPNGVVVDNGDTADGCYNVSGLGTSTVTVLRIDSPGCKGISHVDGNSVLGAPPQSCIEHVITFENPEDVDMCTFDSGDPEQNDGWISIGDTSVLLQVGNPGYTSVPGSNTPGGVVVEVDPVLLGPGITVTVGDPAESFASWVDIGNGRERIGDQPADNPEGNMCFFSDATTFVGTDPDRGGSNSFYYMTFADPITSLSLDLYDYADDTVYGGAISNSCGNDACTIGAVATLTAFTNDDFTNPVGTAIYTLDLNENPWVDGQIWNLSIPTTDVSFKYATLTLSAADIGTGIDNITFCEDISLPEEICNFDVNSPLVYPTDPEKIIYSPGPHDPPDWDNGQDRLQAINALGPPDYGSGGVTFVSMGFEGSIILEFDSPVGGILNVYEVTNGVWYPEQVSVEVRSDGAASWVNVGIATNLHPASGPSIRENIIDLVAAGYPGIVTQVRITDITPESTRTDGKPGPDYFDLDAVGALACDAGFPPTETLTTTISGMKFEDMNADGDKAGDSGLVDWVITLDCDNDALDAEDATDVNGDYVFSFDLEVGDSTSCTVSETPQVGWINSTPISIGPFDVTAGDVITEQDFGNYQPVSISAYKFEDMNANGADDADPALEGIGITLTYIDGMEVPFEDEQFTDENGLVQWDGLKPGTDFVLTETDLGDFVPSTDDFVELDEQQSGDSDNAVFGNYEPATLQGLKFEDTNANGVHDDGEPGLEGVIITLTGTNEVDIEQATAANGQFLFEDLVPGSYTATETVPPGYVATTDVSTGPHVLVSGQDLVLGYVFGNVEPFSAVKTWTHTDYNWDRICTGYAVVDGIETDECIADRPANIITDDVLADPLDVVDGEFILLGNSNKKGFQNTNPGAFFALTTVDVIVPVDSLTIVERYDDCTVTLVDGLQVPMLELLGSKKNIETALKAAIADSNDNVTEISSKDIVISMDDSSATVVIPGPIDAESTVYVLVKFSDALSGQDVTLPVSCENQEDVIATIDGEVNSPFEVIVSAILSIVEK